LCRLNILVQQLRWLKKFGTMGSSCMVFLWQWCLVGIKKLLAQSGRIFFLLLVLNLFDSVPSTKGWQTERANQCLEMYLHTEVHDTPRQWRRWLPVSSLNCSPFKAP
jgi:hypothetical protein